MSEVYDKITEYVCHGGLYNPELMRHDKVRDLLIESRAEIAKLHGDAEVSRLRLEAAHAEIGRLNEAIRRLAEQDATLSVCNGSVTVTMDGTLTPEEREAVEWAESHFLNDYEQLREERDRYIASNLRGLLDRLGGER